MTDRTMEETQVTTKSQQFTPVNLFLVTVAGLAIVAFALEHGMVREANTTVMALARPTAPATPPLNLQPLIEAVNANRRLTDKLTADMVGLTRLVSTLSERLAVQEGRPKVEAPTESSTNKVKIVFPAAGVPTGTATEP